MVSYQPPPPSGAGAPYPASAYQSYGYAGSTPAGSGPQATSGLATALTVLFALVSVAGLVAALAAFHRASIYDSFSSHLLSGDVKDADDTFRATTSIFSILVLAIAPVFIVWQFRHARNAEALSGPLGLGPGWAIGGWFIPLANYVVPELQLYRAAAASDPDAQPRQGRAPGIIVVWWAVFAAGGLVYSIGSVMHPSNDDVTVGNLNDKVDQFARADRVTGFGYLLMVGAAVAALLMVRRLTERQRTALVRRGPLPSQASAYGTPQPTAYGTPEPPFIIPPPSAQPGQQPWQPQPAYPPPPGPPDPAPPPPGAPQWPPRPAPPPPASPPPTPEPPPTSFPPLN